MMQEVVEVGGVINTLVYVCINRSGVACCFMIKSRVKRGRWGCMKGRPRQVVEQETEQTT